MCHSSYCNSYGNAWYNYTHQHTGEGGCRKLSEQRLVTYEVRKCDKDTNSYYEKHRVDSPVKCESILRGFAFYANKCRSIH